MPLGAPGDAQAGGAIEPGQRARRQHQRVDQRQRAVVRLGEAGRREERLAGAAHVAHAAAHMAQVAKQVELHLPPVVLVERFGHRQRALEAAAGFTVGEAADRVGRRQPQILDGFGVVAAPFEMRRQIRGDLVDPGPVDDLAPLGDSQVQTHPRHRRHPLVEHVLKERVGECVAARQRAIRQSAGAAAADKLLTRHQGIEPLFGLRRLDLERRRDGSGGELGAADAGRFEGALLVPAETGDHRVDQLTERIGHDVGDVLEGGHERPPPVDLVENALAHEVGEQIGQKQRIAVGPAVQEPGEAVGKRVGAEARAEIRLDIVEGEQIERDVLAQTAGLQILPDGFQRRRAEREIGRTVGADEQQPARLRAARHQVDEVDGGFVRPVQVVEKKNQRDVGGQRLERFGNLSQHALRCRAEGFALQRLPVGRQHRELRDPGRRITPQHRFDLRPSGLLEESAEGIEHRQVGLLSGRVLDRLPARHPGAVVPLGAREKGLGDARLADAGLTGHEDDLATAARGQRERGVEARERRVAADQRRLVARRSDGALGGATSPCRVVDGDRARTLGERHRREKSIATPVCGFHVHRLLRLVAERPADLSHRDLQHRLTDVNIRPHRVEQLVLADDARPFANEMQQDGQRLRRQVQTIAIFPDLRGAGVDAVGAKLQRRIWIHDGAGILLVTLPVRNDFRSKLSEL